MKDLIRTGLVEAMIRPMVGPLIGGMGGGGPETTPQTPMNFSHNSGAFAVLIDGSDGNDYVNDSGDPIIERNELEPTVYGSLSGNNHTSIGSGQYYYEFLIVAEPASGRIGLGFSALDNRSSTTDIRHDYWNGWYSDGVKINNPNYASNGSQTTWAGTFGVGDRVGVGLDQALDDLILYVNGVEVDRIELSNTGTNNYLTPHLLGEGGKLDHSAQAYLPSGFSEY
ncbi:hypothetical protein ABMA84_15750 [Halobacteriovorax sp. XZX-2]|uniref:hypothetical protein n=1 Tax=unclassified Halobacteriovorax TaxID=2639665 RepID=UPI003710A141